jgi:hypothetical protein
LNQWLAPTCVGLTGAEDISEATISNSTKPSGALNDQCTEASIETIGLTVQGVGLTGAVGFASLDRHINFPMHRLVQIQGVGLIGRVISAQT